MNKINLNGEEYIKTPFKAHHRIKIKSPHIYNICSEEYIYDVIVIPGKHSWRNAKYIENFFIAEEYESPDIYVCVKILQQLKKLGSRSKCWKFSFCLDLEHFITSEYRQLGEDGNEVYVANVHDEVDYLDWDKSKCKLTNTTFEDYRLILVKQVK